MGLNFRSRSAVFRFTAVLSSAVTGLSARTTGRVLTSRVKSGSSYMMSLISLNAGLAGAVLTAALGGAVFTRGTGVSFSGAS